MPETTAASHARTAFRYLVALSYSVLLWYIVLGRTAYE